MLFAYAKIFNHKKISFRFWQAFAAYDFTWGSLVKGVSHSKEQNKILVNFELVNVNTNSTVNIKYMYFVLQCEIRNSLCEVYLVEVLNLKPKGCAGIH